MSDLALRRQCLDVLPLRSTPSDQPSQVFLIPELLRKILYDIDHPKTLGRCARVNKTWYEIAIRRLWHGSEKSYDLWRSPGIEDLRRIAAISSRQLKFYLSITEKLTLRHNRNPGSHPPDHETCGPFVRALDWSSFRGSFVENREDCLGNKDLKAILKPSVRGLLHYSLENRDNFLQSLKDVCSLQVLEIFSYYDTVTRLRPHEIEALFKAHPLIVVELLRVVEPHSMLTSDVAQATALKAVLQKTTLLHAAVSLPRSVPQPLFAHPVTSGLFSLHLDLPHRNTAIAHIFQYVPNLEVLHLSQNFGDLNFDEQVLGPITTCPQLRVLQVLALHDSVNEHYILTATPGRFLKFAEACRKMEEISIWNHLTASESYDLAEESLDYADMLCCWPNLRCFRLWIDLDIFDGQDIDSIATCCPNLIVLEALGTINIKYLRQYAPVFPALRQLTIGNIIFDYESPDTLDDVKAQAGRAHAELRRYMPNLVSKEDTRFHISVEELENPEDETVFDEEISRLISTYFPERFIDEDSPYNSIVTKIRDDALSSIFS